MIVFVFSPGTWGAKNKSISIDPHEINEEIRDWNATAATSRRTRKRKKLFPTVICFSGPPRRPPQWKLLPRTDVDVSFLRPSVTHTTRPSWRYTRRVYTRSSNREQGVGIPSPFSDGKEMTVLWIISPYYVRTNNGCYVVHGYGYSVPSLRYDAMRAARYCLFYYLTIHIYIFRCIIYKAHNICRSEIKLISSIFVNLLMLISEYQFINHILGHWN